MKETQKKIFSIAARWERKEIDSSEAMNHIFQLLSNEEEKDPKKALYLAATILITLWASLMLIVLYVS